MKRNFKRVLLVFAVMAMAGWLSWQGVHAGTAKEFKRDFFAMDTYFSLKAYGLNAEKALRDCEEKVLEIENDISVTKEDSDIFKLNESLEKERGVELSENSFRLVREALELCRRTKGSLDITLYPVLKLWGFTVGNYRIPGGEELQEAVSYVNYQKIQLDEDTGCIRMPLRAELDLGAVAKGYTGDVLMEILKKEGVTSALLDLGGNVQVLGTKPDGSPWNVGIKNPFDSGEILGVVEVVDQAVVTSGIYERFFIGEDGQKYWHILNPQTGYPADGGLVSVTVVGAEGAVCDGLSTALFVMGKEEAVENWKNCDDFEMILVEGSGRILYTEGLEGRFTVKDGWNAEVLYAK